MKKVLLSICTILTGLSLQAQLVNGDFEGTSSNPIPGSTAITDSPGWGIGFYTIESTGAFAGTKAAKLETIKDPALLATLTAFGIPFPNDTFPGLISQSVPGPVANASNMTLSFVYKNNTVLGDSAVVAAQILDTMLADVQGQPSDDVVLYQGFAVFTGTQNTWTPFSAVLPANTGVNVNNYTANSILFIASSSIDPLFGTGNGFVGSKLWLDNVSLTSQPNGLEETTLNTRVYPNPATDVLNIKMDEEIESVVITSVDGKVVSKGNSSTLSVSDLNSGVYVYEVTSVTGKVSKGNFIKQ